MFTWKNNKPTEGEYYSATLAVPRKNIYEVVKLLRSARSRARTRRARTRRGCAPLDRDAAAGAAAAQVGGSGVLVSPVTYIFDEEPPRWRALLKSLGKE